MTRIGLRNVLDPLRVLLANGEARRQREGVERALCSSFMPVTAVWGYLPRFTGRRLDLGQSLSAVLHTCTRVRARIRVPISRCHGLHWTITSCEMRVGLNDPALIVSSDLNVSNKDRV